MLSEKDEVFEFVVYPVCTIIGFALLAAVVLFVTQFFFGVQLGTQTFEFLAKGTTGTTFECSRWWDVLFFPLSVLIFFFALLFMTWADGNLPEVLVIPFAIYWVFSVILFIYSIFHGFVNMLLGQIGLAIFLILATLAIVLLIGILAAVILSPYFVVVGILALIGVVRKIFSKG